eukprot:scaffold2109_cov123-Isochrysis_galbana.AAC.22
MAEPIGPREGQGRLVAERGDHSRLAIAHRAQVRLQRAHRSRPTGPVAAGTRRADANSPLHPPRSRLRGNWNRRAIHAGHAQ